MNTLNKQNSSNLDSSINLHKRQIPIRESYKAIPELARIKDSAMTSSDKFSADNPLYGQIIFNDPNKTEVDYSLHSGVGGNGEFPVPGDLLRAALPGCLDTSIKVVANMYQIQLKSLSVKVEGFADLRGTLKMEKSVPVGFLDISIDVEIETVNAVDKEKIPNIIQIAESCCVVLQTLKNPVPISLNQH